MAERLSPMRVVAGFTAVAVLALPVADLELAGHDPWAMIGRMLSGFARPDFGAVEALSRALAMTVAFAVAGVALGAAAGLALAPFYDRAVPRALCVALRSVHEIFWALLLIQAIGIGAPAGVLALALPYAGIFAKVFAEQIEEADPRPSCALPPRSDAVSRFAYAAMPLIRAPMLAYCLYRLECGMRASAVIGFIGLPTLGFQLDSFFRKGDYGAASAVLICYIVMIATLRWWMRPRLAPLWIVASVAMLATLNAPPMGEGALWRFLSQDIIPQPLRGGEGPAGLIPWLQEITLSEIGPGLWNTLIATQIALVLTGLIAFLSFGSTITAIAGRWGSVIGHLALVVLRSLPEYMLAYLFLQIFGPSLLPAILALGLHNGAIIGHLLGREADALIPGLRADHPRGLLLWGWELVPRIFGRFLALCLYRWEIILRESAVMGILGIATLGFFIDSALAELRIDRAVVLLIAIAFSSAVIDRISVRVRARMKLPKLSDADCATDPGPLAARTNPV
ncbi:PhnE/PtxC family ABC transporter permease [Paracoccus sediminicola]|uniref:PhnE/PtxC family ABC transporter permease n=1 Tax=Paracoccus sediminicola TaxID=3017783 RepID=UPI0022F02833|nr:ABC transporter permease [Paracoccus sediminicola]WBU57758.1 ABC transporter permease [Paracoccus sediminicola]